MNLYLKRIVSIVAIVSVVMSVSMFSYDSIAAVKVAAPKIKKVEYNNSRQKVKLTWRKINNSNGYQIQYSTSKNFKGRETVKINKKSTIKKTIEDLLPLKTYYFRIRALKKVKTKKGRVKTVYSKYSKVKKVKTRPYYTTPQALDKKTVGVSTMKSNITQKNYKLKFFDDFNGTQLNSSYWSFDHPCSSGAEAQVNIEENLSIRDGNAVLTANKDTILHNKYANGIDGEVIGQTYYTGAKFNSRDKVYYKYGRFEMYAKLPKGSGSWPAFWTLGQHSGWPWGGEIDILEMAGFDYGYYSAIHWCDPDEPATSAYGTGHLSLGGVASALPDLQQVKMADDYHVIGMEWTPEKIYFYLDGKESGSISITRSSMSYAMHCEHYMIINYALGGMGGAIDDSVFPQNMYVDWVKVWQTY